MSEKLLPNKTKFISEQGVVTTVSDPRQRKHLVKY